MVQQQPHDGVVEKLEALAGNLWWSWQSDIRAIFRSLDPEQWRLHHHNPVAMLRVMDRETITRRVQDLEMLTRIDQAYRRLQQYLKPRRTWAMDHVGPIMAWPVAYFSAEFGLHHSIPIYSGGLGVLAGDHLKSMSDLGVPTAGVGLLYHQGYVHQHVDAEGWQRDHYEAVTDQDLAILPVNGRGGPLDSGDQLKVVVELPDADVHLRVWQVPVGRTVLYLLDARDDANPPEIRALTGRLYGGDERTRIQQEMLLGVGGHRALVAAGVAPSVLHLNEGHSAFALLERARHLVEREALAPDEAFERVARSSVFTTHTPVEAGHDRFDPAVAAAYLAPIAAGLGISVDQVVALGLEHGDSGPFCPTVLAMHLAHRVNGVSALHGHVSRRMWHHLSPERPQHRVPIGHITNGVHAGTWMAGDIESLLDRVLGSGWRDESTDPELWKRLDELPEAELWEVHQVLKARMLAFVRSRDAARRERLGMAAAEVLAPDVLTVGFARRFATYKRADLVLRDLDRLEAMLTHAERPVQLVFAGKAHPRDEPGKAIAQRLAALEGESPFAGRIVFVEDYSMHVARQLVQGVDAWLNTPRRPLEACGTSGMKCAMNGVLNISILDGWWAEAFDGANGFAIGSGEAHAHPAVQDERDAASLYDVLEREVIPLYYARDADGLPRGWIARMKRSMQTLSWRFNADRMVMDYVRCCYRPAAGGESADVPGEK
ncbi:MAG TPA: alpha-glucan family phosphorylase [Thermoanaerobaculia bacterium]|nr:alpha-glucan family phosphorylase [Thermoanaerobaculia bacterium]